jgi:hypothetical protein
VLDTLSAVNAYKWLVLLFIPEDRSQRAGFNATSASNTFPLVKNDPPMLSLYESIGGADLHAGRIAAASANHNDEPAFNPASRSYPYG